MSLHRLFHFAYDHLGYYDPSKNPADLLQPSHCSFPPQALVIVLEKVKILIHEYIYH
jgi:hypothetical protein